MRHMYQYFAKYLYQDLKTCQVVHIKGAKKVAKEKGKSWDS